MKPQTQWTAFLVLLVLVGNSAYASFCQDTERCLCTAYEEVEYQCPREDPDVIVKISEDHNVNIQCLKENTPLLDTSVFPRVNASGGTVFQMAYCYFNLTFADIFENFHMTDVKAVMFESWGKPNSDRDIYLTKDMFESLDSLENLALTFSSLNFASDFLANTPNIKLLSLTKNNIADINWNFKYVPKLLALDLSRNQIESLSNGVFQDLKNLTKLYLWNNNITKITKEMLVGLENLQLLELSNNHISDIEEDAFSELYNLTSISLRSNQLTRTYSNMFKNNRLLQKIRLSYTNTNESLVIAEGLFANLTHLDSVEISNNNLLELPGNVFENSKNLSDIYLGGNQLKSLPESIFAGLSMLKTLDLADNKLTFLPDQVFLPLTNLEKLLLTKNKLRSISANLFQKLTKLKYLDISKNNIAAIELSAFRNLRSLTYIDISYNRWNSSYAWVELTPLNDCISLEEIHLSHNLIQYYPEILALTQLKKIDLSYNLLEYIEIGRFARSISNTFDVNLENNKIQYVNFDYAERTAMENQQPYDAAHYTGSSTVIHLDYNPVLCDCSNFELVRYNNDEMEILQTLVEIKQDQLYCANDNKTLVKNLKPQHILCPAFGQCPSECSCSYMPFNGATVIDCSFRNLTEYPVLTFNLTQTKLAVLNLSGNALRDGPKKDLNYDNVTTLDLSSNFIGAINWIPSHLQEFNLTSNKLQRLDSHFLDKLKNSSSHVWLELGDNPWVCDCEASNLQEYLMQYYQKVNSTDVYCHNSDIQLVKVTNLCTTSAYLTVLLPIVLSVLLCFSIAAAIYYRYQTEIKIYLYAKNLCLWFVTEEELDKDKTYDVFISYAHQDEKFVIDNLLSELEHGEMPFKVCIHIRDWVPGEFISKQVVSSVKDSRRTMVILSNNFVDSVWGKLEFRTAHTEAISEGRARVIVVILGDLDENKLDDELKSYLKSNTYVKWGDKYFWNKLRYALPHSKGSFYETNKKHAKMMLKIDDKFDLIKNPPSPSNTSTPPITLDPSLLESKEIKISIPQVDGEAPLLVSKS